MSVPHKLNIKREGSDIFEPTPIKKSNVQNYDATKASSAAGAEPLNGANCVQSISAKQWKMGVSSSNYIRITMRTWEEVGLVVNYLFFNIFYNLSSLLNF